MEKSKSFRISGILHECVGSDHKEPLIPHYGIQIGSCKDNVSPINDVKQKRDAIILALQNNYFGNRQ